MIKKIISLTLCVLVLISVLGLTACGAKEVEEYDGQNAQDALLEKITELTLSSDYTTKTEKAVGTAKIWFITLYEDKEYTSETAETVILALSSILDGDNCTVKCYQDNQEYYFTVEYDGYLADDVDSLIFTIYLDEDGRIVSIVHTETTKEFPLDWEIVITHNISY